MTEGSKKAYLIFDLQLRCFFRHSKIINDVAIVRMTTPATMSDTVKSICLTKLTIPASAEAIATGWGGTDEAATQSQVLKQVVFICLSHA